MRLSMSAACSISASSRPPRLSSASSTFGARRQRPRHLELLQSGRTEPVDARRGIGRQADQVERIERVLLRLAPGISGSDEP
jgi:hypothetical protein